MTPEKYLEKLQERYNPEIFNMIRKTDKEKVGDSIIDAWSDVIEDKKIESFKLKSRQFLKKLDSQDARDKLPTRFEDTLTYNLLQSLVKDVQEALSDMRIEFPGAIVFGTLPTERVNATAIKVEDDGELVVFNIGLFLFIYLFAKAIATFLEPEMKNGGLILHVPTDIEIINNKLGISRFIFALFCQIKLNNIGLVKPYYLEGKKMVFANELTKTAEFFVVAHEYAHRILKHHEQSEQTQNITLGMVEVTEIIQPKEMELEADNLALYMTLVRNRKAGHDLASSYLGIDLFFSILDLEERIRRIKASKTHPLAKERRFALRDAVKIDFPEDSEHVLKIADMYEGIINTIWEKYKHVFDELSSQLN